MIIRVVAPACMLFLVNFKTYLFFVLPSALVSIAATHITSYDIIMNKIECPMLVRNYDVKSAITKDFAVMIFLSMGFYSYSKTLASRFIN